MVSAANTVVYLPKSTKEKREVEKFIRRSLKRWYNCELTPLPPDVIAVKRDGTIVGTVVLYFSKDDSHFPMEEIYKFHQEDMPLSLSRSCIVQFGRWIATAEGVSRILLYASAIYGIKAGCLYGLAEVKPKIAEILEGIGVKLSYIPGVIRWDKIPKQIKPYYEEQPQPRACLVNLDQKRILLEAEILDIVARDQLILNIH